MFMFQGYGVMVGNPEFVLRHWLEDNAKNNGSPVSHTFHKDFQVATATFQFAKLSMRVCQIAFLVFLKPNGLVYVAYSVMAVGVFTPLLFVWALGVSDLWVVYFQYICGGIAVGLFEGTFLSCISGLGKSTKTAVIMGAPLGFAMNNTVIATLCANPFNLTPVLYFVWCLVCLPVGAFIFYTYAPVAAAGAASGKGCDSFSNSMKKWIEWMPLMAPWFVAKFIGNFVLEDGFPFLFNVMNTKLVPMWSFDPSTTDISTTISMDHYKAFYWFVLMAMGDTISRRVPHYVQLAPPMSAFGGRVAFWIIFSIALCVGGEALCFLVIPIISGIAAFISNFGNGFIYGLSAKFIDAYIPIEHHYAAYNMWCFCGDLGGWAGQGGLSVDIANAACEGRNYTFVCHQDPPKMLEDVTLSSTSTMLTSGLGESAKLRMV